MWIYYPLLIVIIGVILLTKWVDCVSLKRHGQEDGGARRSLKRYAIVFLAFILIGAIAIPTAGNDWPLWELFLVLFIPFFRWKDIRDSGRTEEMKSFYRNMAGVVIAIVIVAGVFFMRNTVFSPMERFKNAMKDGRFQSAQSIYTAMSGEQKNEAGNWLTAQFGVMGEYYESRLKGGYLDQE